MSVNIMFCASDDNWLTYAGPLMTAFEDAGLDVDLSRDHAAKAVDYIVFAPTPGQDIDFSKFPRLRAVMGLWAGVEKIVGNPTLNVPLSRMVDTGLSEGMTEWVCGHVLRYHLGMDRQFVTQNGNWAPEFPPLARDRRIGILGLGELGTACADALSQLNFQVRGWSKRPKSLPGIQCFDGLAGLSALLSQTEILVLLLPLTKDTENLMNAERFGQMPEGARLINPGRGALINDQDLLDALDSGHIAHATLDVFRTEPLPKNHAFWSHPRVTVTPHIASTTRADTSAKVIAENLQRHLSGQPMQFLVDRKAGY